jgi:hypothetical protein
VIRPGPIQSPITPLPITSGGTSSTLVPGPAKLTLQAENANASSGVTRASTYVTNLDSGDWLKFSNVDFGSGVTKVTFNVAVDPLQVGGELQVRVGSPSGPVISSLPLRSTGSSTRFAPQTVNIGIGGVQTIYIVVYGGNRVGSLDWIQFS